MGWSLSGQIDFSEWQVEIAFFYILAFIMAIYVFYDSTRCFYTAWRHLFWLLTLLTGPVGLGIYVLSRRIQEAGAGH